MEDLHKIYTFLDNIDELGLERANEEIPNQLRIVLGAAVRNPIIFSDFCFQDRETREYWRSAPFHHEWQELFPEPYSGKYTAIFAPRAHAKTSQVVMARPLHLLGQNPGLAIKIVCASDQRAKKRVQELQQHIGSNHRLRLVFPHLRPDEKSGWEKHRFFIQRELISREPTVEAYGILSGATGDRADIVIFDDIVDMKNAIMQPKYRTMVKDAFRFVWLNLLGPNGTALYIATPWHLDDLSSEIMADPTWQIWKEPAIDKDGNPLWPDKWPIKALEKKRNEITDPVFQQQFMLEALSSEDATFSEDAIQACMRPINYGEWHRGDPVPKHWSRFMGVDPGASMGTSNSPSVIMTIAVNPEDQTRYPLHVYQRKMKFPQLIEVILSEYDTHKPSLILGETNSFQEAMKQQLSDMRKDLPIESHYTGSRKWDMVDGLPGLSNVMSNGGWVIPKPCKCNSLPCHCHPPSCSCISCDWERELRYHPKWRSADIVMAQWLCETAARKGMPRPERKFISLQKIFDEYDKEKGEAQ